MKRSRSSFLKWLLVGPIILVPGCILIWLSLTTMIEGKGLTVYVLGVAGFVFGLILTCIGWFDKLGLHKYVLSWMEK